MSASEAIAHVERVTGSGPSRGGRDLADELERLYPNGGVYGASISPDRFKRILAALRQPAPRADDALRTAARKLLAWRIGELPHRGWLRDNVLSRAALDELSAALASDAPTDAKGDE